MKVELNLTITYLTAVTYSILSGEPVAIAEKLLVFEERNAAPPFAPPPWGDVGEVAAAAISATSSGSVCNRLGAKMVAKLVASILLPGSEEPGQTEPRDTIWRCMLHAAFASTKALTLFQRRLVLRVVRDQAEKVEEDEEGVPVDLRQELHDPLQRQRLLRRRRYL